MYKTIKLEGHPADVYTSIISRIRFKITSDTEVFVMQSLVRHSTNMSITMTKEANSYVANEVGITLNLLSTTLHRLEKKQTIRRTGRTILLHPAFNELETIKGIVFSVSPTTQTSQD